MRTMFSFQIHQVALLAALMTGAPCQAGEEPQVLTRVAAIRSLSREQAAKALPVRLRGVVIWQDSAPAPTFFVHDGQWSIWVDRMGATTRNVWQGGELPRQECEVGALVEIEGFTDPGGYAPCVIPVVFHRVGSAPLPEARATSMDSILSGREDGQRVVMEGVVQSVSPPDRFGDSIVMLMAAGHLCKVSSENGRDLDAGSLVDAEVRVTGCSSPVYNLRAETTGIRLLAQGPADFKVITPPPGDPFAARKLPLHQLLQFTLVPDRFHRRVTQGTVNFRAPGKFFFIQEGTTGVRVESSTSSVEVGDLVEVSAFVDTSRTLASMREAVVRTLGHGSPPVAEPVTAERIFRPARTDPTLQNGSGDHSGRLVRIVGSVQKSDSDEAGNIQTLLVRSGDRVFHASIPLPAGLRAPTWDEGSVVDLSGVCELDFEKASVAGDLPDIVGFKLWLRSPQDVRVISVPSWWTPKRLGIALSGVALLMMLAMVWNLALRRILLKRSQQLEEVMREYRNAEIEFQGVRKERRRLASDLHDGLQQLMAGAAYRVEAAAAYFEDIPPAVENQLTAAHRAMVRAQAVLRQALWGLQHMEEDSRDFVALLRHAVGTIEHWPAGAVAVTCQGETYPVSRKVMGGLLLLMQETVGNAFKHGGAKHVSVSLAYHPDFFEMRIDDDGCGFDPRKAPGPREGHFGLEAIRLRMKWLGGNIVLRSTPGEGCTLACKIPKSLATEPDSKTENADGMKE